MGMTGILLIMLALQSATLVADWKAGFLLITVLGVCYIYFGNNPVGHQRKFRIRSFLNWFPMGLLYAFLYMGRYNLTVSKTALGSLMTKESFGLIFAAGTITYAFSFLINGPLVDKIGGKKGMLIGGAGAALANILMGIMTFMLLHGQLSINTTVAFAILYSLNMYFQSYGAVSIVKVNAHWFHVKERGIFGGIFGTLISLGIYFAFTWGQAIVNATSVEPSKEVGLFGGFLRTLLGSETSDMNQTWFVFFIPAVLLLIMFVIELFLLKDTPEEAGFDSFDTEDASSGEMDQEFTSWQIIKKILTNPIILTIAGIEFCSGVLRNGIMHWYWIFVAEAGPTIQQGSVFFKSHWGELLSLAGIYGGFFAGIMSDRIFGSRRGPSATLNYAGLVLCMVVTAIVLWKFPIALGVMMITSSFLVIGVHGLLSGTATMDFGGRRGAATAVGVVDGFVYLGTGVQSLSLGYITSWNWTYWPIFLIPFSLIGTFLAIRIWKAFPDSKRKGAA